MRIKRGETQVRIPQYIKQCEEDKQIVYLQTPIVLWKKQFLSADSPPLERCLENYFQENDLDCLLRTSILITTN